MESKSTTQNATIEESKASDQIDTNPLHPFSKPNINYKLDDLVAERKPIPEYDFDVDQVWAFLEKGLAERILYLDGGMGTEIQQYKLQE